MKQRELAEKLGTTLQTVNRIIKGKQGISAPMALKLGELFGTTPQFWLNMQMSHDLFRAVLASEGLEPPKH